MSRPKDFSQKKRRLIKLFSLILLILTGLLIPIFYKDVGCEFVYGGGNWNPLQSKILFQGFEDKGVDQTRLAIFNNGWKALEAGFSPSEKESEMIYGYELPDGFKAGQLHAFTAGYGDNGYVKVSVSSDQKHWKVLIEDGRDWRLQRSEGKKTEEWVERKHDVGIPGKYLKDKLYIKFSGACRAGNDEVSVDQWGVKVWKKQSLMGMMRDGFKNTGENIEREGGFTRWLRNRLRYQYQNIANESEVICKDRGENLRKTVDGSPLTTRPVAIPENHQHQATMVFDFGKPRAIGKIGIFFWGDLHRATSYHATEYKIEGLCNGEWLTIGEEKDNRDPLVTHYVNPRYQLTQVKVTFTKAFLDHMVQVGEVYLYEREKVSLIQGIGHFLSQYNKSLPASFLYTFLFLAMLFFPGYCIAQAFPERILDEEDKFVFSFFFSVILYVLISLGGLFSKISSIYDLILPISMTGLVIFVYKGWWKKVAQLDRTLLIVLPLFLFFSTLYQYRRDLVYALPHLENYLSTLTRPDTPYYGYGGDNLLQWLNSKFLLRDIYHFEPGDWKYMFQCTGYYTGLFDRTPLLSLLNVPFLSVFGESHFIYERLLTVVAGFFLIPIYLGVKKIFNNFVAKITVLALLLQNILFFMSCNVEAYYKYFAFFPVALAFFLLAKYGMSRLSIAILTGLACGISYFTHDGIAGTYLPSLFLFAFAARESFWAKLKWISLIFIICLMFALLWKTCCATYGFYFSPFIFNLFNFSSARMHTMGCYLEEVFMPFNEVTHFLGQGGFVPILSLPLCLLFMFAIMTDFKRYFRLIPLWLVSPLMVIILRDGYQAGTTLGAAYFTIPFVIAISFDFLSRQKGTLGKMLLFAFALFYIGHNLYRSSFKSGGNLLSAMIHVNHLQKLCVVTYIGIFVYVGVVSFLIFRTIVLKQNSISQIPGLDK